MSAATAPARTAPKVADPVRSLVPAMLVPGLSLAVVTATLGVSAVLGMPVAGAALLHAVVLLAYGAGAWLVHRIGRESLRTAAAGLLVIASMFLLYSTLGHVTFDAIPWNGDGLLRAADRWIGLGVEPAQWLSDAIAPSRGAVEALAFFYAAFIPYLYLSIFLTLVGRPAAERSGFIATFGVLYGLSFIGYLFVPARGPIVAMAGEFEHALNGGPFLDLVVASIDGMGGPHGAFPSLHLGASLMVCLYDFRHGDPLRGLIYVPLVVMIAFATVALRYHWVVDLLAGGALALLALAIGPRLAGMRRSA